MLPAGLLAALRRRWLLLPAALQRVWRLLPGLRLRLSTAVLWLALTHASLRDVLDRQHYSVVRRSGLAEEVGIR